MKIAISKWDHYPAFFLLYLLFIIIWVWPSIVVYGLLDARDIHPQTRRIFLLYLCRQSSYRY